MLKYFSIRVPGHSVEDRQSAVIIATIATSSFMQLGLATNFYEKKI